MNLEYTLFHTALLSSPPCTLAMAVTNASPIWPSVRKNQNVYLQQSMCWKCTMVQYISFLHSASGTPSKIYRFTNDLDRDSNTS